VINPTTLPARKRKIPFAIPNTTCFR